MKVRELKKIVNNIKDDDMVIGVMTRACHVTEDVQIEVHLKGAEWGSDNYNMLMIKTDLG